MENIKWYDNTYAEFIGRLLGKEGDSLSIQFISLW